MVKLDLLYLLNRCCSSEKLKRINPSQSMRSGWPVWVCISHCTRTWALQSAGSWCCTDPCPQCAMQRHSSTSQSRGMVCWLLWFWSRCCSPLCPEWCWDGRCSIQSHPAKEEFSRGWVMVTLIITSSMFSSSCTVNYVVEYVSIKLKDLTQCRYKHMTTHWIIQRSTDISPIKRWVEGQVLPELPLQLIKICISRIAEPTVRDVLRDSVQTI